MTTRPVSPLLWLLSGAAALAAGIVLLILFTKNTTPPLDLDPSRPHEAAAAPSAVASSEERYLGTEPSTRRHAEPAPASRAASKYDRRYLDALGGIRGRVVIKDRGPLPDFPIEAFAASLAPFVPSLDALLGDGEPPAIRVGATRTDEQGQFLISDVKPRSFHILLLGAGSARATFRFVDRSPAPGEVVDVGDIALPIGGTLTGTVRDQDGSPVAGARVCVADFPGMAFSVGLGWLDGEGGLLVKGMLGKTEVKVIAYPAWIAELEKRSPLPETSTDAEGAFRLEGVAPGRPMLWVRKKGLIPLTHGPVACDDGKEKAVGQLAMKKGETLSGQVVDGTGAAVPGADVMVGPVGIDMVPLTVLRRVGPTDAKGDFRVECVGREKLMVVARRELGDAWTCVGPLPSDDAILVRLEEGGSLRVFVLGVTGTVARDATITVAAETEVFEVPGLGSPLPLEKRTTVGEDGYLRITGLKSGTYRVLARAPGHVSAAQSVKLEGAVEHALRLQLVAEVEGRIQVVDDATSEPVAFADVMARTSSVASEGLLSDGSVPFRIGISDVRGEVVVTGLPAGTHEVHVAHPRYGHVKGTLVLPGVPLVVRMPVPGSVVGLVTKNGGPPGERHVIALEQRGTIDVDPPAMTCSAPDGTFSFNGVAPGTYTVEVMPHLSRITSFMDMQKLAEAAEVPQGRAEVQVTAGQQSTVTLALEGQAATASGPTGRIVGQVLVNGAPALDLVVTAWSHGSQRTKTDGAGRFELKHVRADTQLWIGVTDSEGVPNARNLASRSVKVGEGETLEVNFSVVTGHLRGRVVKASDGSPVSGLSVVANRVPGGKPEEESQDNCWFSATTDEQGRFRVKNAVAGKYMFSVQSEDNVLKEPVSTEVRAGEESPDVELRVIAGVKVSGRVEIVEEEKDLEWRWLHFQRKGVGDGKGVAVEGDMRFEIAALAPDSYDVSFHSSGVKGYQTVRLEVTGPMSGVHLRFEPVKREPPKPEGGKGEKKDG